jgi:hypothetical protein
MTTSERPHYAEMIDNILAAWCDDPLAGAPPFTSVDKMFRARAIIEDVKNKTFADPMEIASTLQSAMSKLNTMYKLVDLPPELIARIDTISGQLGGLLSRIKGQKEQAPSPHRPMSGDGLRDLRRADI